MSNRNMFLALFIVFTGGGAFYSCSKPATTDTGNTAVPVSVQSVQPAVHKHVFDGTREETQRFMDMNRDITLTSDQEAVRLEALSQLPAPCCGEFSAATCCCECNIARAIWGLSKSLIVEGAEAAEVKEDVQAWLKAVNSSGYTGEACSLGKCSKSPKEGGCGGMEEDNLIS